MRVLGTILFDLKASSFRTNDLQNIGDLALSKHLAFPRSLNLSHTNKIKSGTQTAYLEPPNLDYRCPVITICQFWKYSAGHRGGLFLQGQPPFPFLQALISQLSLETTLLHSQPCALNEGVAVIQTCPISLAATFGWETCMQPIQSNENTTWEFCWSYRERETLHSGRSPNR